MDISILILCDKISSISLRYYLSSKHNDEKLIKSTYNVYIFEYKIRKNLLLYNLFIRAETIIQGDYIHAYTQICF